MATPVFTRRRMLREAAIGLGVLSCTTALGQPFEHADYVGVETSLTDGLSHIFALGASGQILARLPVGFRAHGLAESDTHLIVFPRRPGNKFAIIDKANFDIRATVTAPASRHFFGHGAVTSDGAYLLTTENDLDQITGVVGIYELATGRRLGEVPLPGAGPHEIIRHATRDLFFVALGGLETHPDYGRTPFNLSSFRSQIVQLDFTTLRPDALGHWAGSEGVSLRHLAMDQAGRLYVGGQVYDRARADGGNLVWLVGESGVTALEVGDRLGGYVSSVAASGSGAMLASKTTGDVLWLEGDQLLKSERVTGASAVASTQRGPVYSGARLLRLGAQEQDALAGFEFDNHGLAVRGMGV